MAETIHDVQYVRSTSNSEHIIREHNCIMEFSSASKKTIDAIIAKMGGWRPLDHLDIVVVPNLLAKLGAEPAALQRSLERPSIPLGVQVSPF